MDTGRAGSSEQPLSPMDEARLVEIIPGDRFHDASFISTMEQKVLSYEDEDDRDNLRYAMARRLIDEWVLDKAETLARSLERWKIEETWLLGDIADRLAKLGQKPRALGLLEEAASIAGSHHNPTLCADVLLNIAKHLACLGEQDSGIAFLAEATSHARNGENSGDLDGSKVLVDIAERLAVAGEWQSAREVAGGIKNDFVRQRALTRLDKMFSIAMGCGNGQEAV